MSKFVEDSGAEKVTGRVEELVATSLQVEKIDWDGLKPIFSFVVLWNRLEARSSQNKITHRWLRNQSMRVANQQTFDISRYNSHIDFFKERYSSDRSLLTKLYWGGGNEIEVEMAVNRLLEDSSRPEASEVPKKSISKREALEAALMISWRVRNNLFHGRKDTARLYAQNELFTHVNEILCQFLSDMP